MEIGRLVNNDLWFAHVSAIRWLEIRSFLVGMCWRICCWSSCDGHLQAWPTMIDSCSNECNHSAR